MLILEHDRIEVDHCQVCGGLWFDAAELTLLLPSADLFWGEGGKAAAGRERSRRCPHCRRRMEKIAFDRGQLLLDRCPAGGGLWFDRGELARAAQRLAGTEAARRVAHFLSQMFGGRTGPAD